MSESTSKSSATNAKGRRYRGVSNEARKAERRMKLIAAGIKLFGTEGYHAATIKGLCHEAGLTERYFYESFANAEALFTECYLHITETIRVELQGVLSSVDEGDLEKAAASGLTAFFGYFKDRPEAARIILVEVLTVNKRLTELSLKTLYDFVGMLETLARPLIAQNNPGDKLDPSLLASGLVGAVLYMAARWSLEGSRKPVEDVVENTMLIFRGVGMSLMMDKLDD